MKASPPGKTPGLVSINHIPKNIDATINKIGIENTIMIALPSLRCFVSFMKNSPKKKRNNHPGYSGIELRKLIKVCKQFHQGDSQAIQEVKIEYSL